MSTNGPVMETDDQLCSVSTMLIKEPVDLPTAVNVNDRISDQLQNHN